jgi:hypothetical protein
MSLSAERSDMRVRSRGLQRKRDVRGNAETRAEDEDVMGQPSSTAVGASDLPAGQRSAAVACVRNRREGPAGKVVMPYSIGRRDVNENLTLLAA